MAGRLLQRTQELLKTVTFRRYQKVGKRLWFKIVNPKGEEKRRPLFKKMLKYQKACIGHWGEQSFVKPKNAVRKS